MKYKISIPFYLIGFTFIAFGIYYFYDYLQDYKEIRSYRKWKRVPNGATVTHIISDVKDMNIFSGFPLMNLIGSTLLPGKMNIVELEYQYDNGEELVTSRDYDLLGSGFSSKLDVAVEVDRLRAGPVDMYVDPTGKRSYIRLSTMEELGLPYLSIFYLLIGAVFIYGGLFLPKLFDFIPTKLNDIFFKRLSTVIPLDLEVGQKPALGII